VQRRPLTTTLLLTIIKLLKVGALLSWGRFSPREPGPDLDPHPPMRPPRSGFVFPKSNMAFSRRSANNFRTFYDF
jgi:hypothetical protein